MSLALPLSSNAQSRCFDIFSLQPSVHTTAPRTEIRTITNGFFSHADPLLQGFINKTERILKKFTVPKKIKITVANAMAAGIVPVSFGCGAFNHINRSILIHSKLYKDLSSQGREFLEGVVQHEFGHYIFLLNMGRYSTKWNTWVERMNNRFIAEMADALMVFSMGAPKEQIEISVPYQEVFADLVTVLALNKPNSMSDNLQIYFGSSDGRNFRDLTPEARLKEEARLQETADNIASRGFDKSFFDMKWTQKEEHGMLGPVRVYLWETYFSKDKNKGREDEILWAVFDVMAREIVARSENSALVELPPEQVNARLLNALHAGLAAYQ